jgi:hypothetical protein
MYLQLLKSALTNLIYEDAPIPFLIQQQADYSREARQAGHDWPSAAHTMIGTAGLDNVQNCLDRVVADGVPGDFIETGVWRGGVCIFARGYFKVRSVEDRRVWVADSFEGMPEIGEDGHPLDHKYAWHRLNDILGVSEKTVRDNFAKYDLLDDSVRFLKGRFRDTLPVAPVERLAVLRLDGDLYESTRDALVNLYPKLSVGGYVIIDDYLIPQCQEAVHEYRAEQDIEFEQIEEIPNGNGGVFWRRTR